MRISYFKQKTEYFCYVHHKKKKKKKEEKSINTYFIKSN